VVRDSTRARAAGRRMCLRFMVVLLQRKAVMEASLS
jgi:hypothetical protein